MLETRLRSFFYDTTGGSGSGSSVVYAPTGGPYVLYSANAALPAGRIIAGSDNITIVSSGTSILISANTGTGSGGSTSTAGLVQSSLLISTIYPLSGGGDLSVNRSHSVDTLFLVNTGRQITGAGGLTGGGNFSTDRTISLTVPVATSLGGIGRTTIGSATTLLGVNSDGLTLSYYPLIASNNAIVNIIGSAWYISAITNAGGGSSVVYAPTGGPYVCFTSNSVLTSELVLTASNNITITTNGTLIYLSANTGGGGAVGGSGFTIVGDATGGTACFDGSNGSQLIGYDGVGDTFQLGQDNLIIYDSSYFQSFYASDGGMTLRHANQPTLELSDGSFQLKTYAGNHFFSVDNNGTLLISAPNGSGNHTLEDDPLGNFIIYDPAESVTFFVEHSTGIIKSLSLDTDNAPPTTSGTVRNVITDGNGKLSFTANGAVVGSADLTGRSAAVSSVLTITVPNDGAKHTYSVGGYITVTAISINTITLQVDYTDETNTSRTASFFGEGLTVAAISGTGFTGFPPMTLRCKENTSITVKTTIVGAGSETYDVGAYIQQIN